MRLGVSLPLQGVDISDVVEVLRHCENAGYQEVWSGEVNGPDFPSMLGAVAQGTNLSLGVGVAPAQTRAPWMLAVTAATLSHLTGKGFSLGIGTSSEVIVSKWSGIPFQRPLRQLREVVEVTRGILDGEKVNYAGEFVNVSGFKLPQAPQGPVPIFIGALNPKSLRQAGEIGDGVCLNQLAPRHVSTVLQEVRAGARDAERSMDDFQVMARLFCAVTDDVAAGRESVRRMFAPYVATTVYNRFFSWLGFEEEAKAVNDAFHNRDREGAVRAMSDDLVDTIAVIGDQDRVAEVVSEYVAAGVEIPVISPMSSDREGALRTLDAIAESLTA